MKTKKVQPTLPPFNPVHIVLETPKELEMVHQISNLSANDEEALYATFKKAYKQTPFTLDEFKEFLQKIFSAFRELKDKDEK